MSTFCQTACLPVGGFGGLPQQDCDTKYRSKDRADVLILALCTFQWNAEVPVPGDTNDPPATVTIGDFTDPAAWQAAKDAGLITAFCINSLEKTIDNATIPGRCGLPAVWKQTTTVDFSVNILPEDKSDFDYFCEVNKLANRGSIKVIGQANCDGTIRLFNTDEPAGVETSGNVSYVDATDDAPAQWEGSFVYETSGGDCQLPLDVPGLKPLLAA